MKKEKKPGLLKRINRRLWKTVSKYGMECRCHIRSGFASCEASGWKKV